MNKNTYIVVIIIIVVLLAVWIFSANAQPKMQLYNETVSATKEFIVKGNNFAFDIKTITVNKGDKVKITLENTGGLHDIKIDEYNVATKKINGGASDTIEFVADKEGSFEYYCSVGTHRQMGMKGTLIVK